MQSHDCSPSRDQDSHVQCRAIPALEENVARDFEDNVRHEKQRQYNVPLNTGDAKIDVDAFNLGVTDIRAVQVGNQVECLARGLVGSMSMALLFLLTASMGTSLMSTL